MQESLSRGLNGASGQAAPATDPKGTGRKAKGEKKGASIRVSSNGPESGGRPKGDSRGRSASPGERQRNYQKHVRLPKGYMHQGERLWVRTHKREIPNPLAPALEPEKAGQHVCFRRWKRQVRKRLQRPTRRPFFRRRNINKGRKREGQTSRRHGGRGPRDFDFAENRPLSRSGT